MATTSNRIAESLPREMQMHTYAILREVEGTHWWYLGRRRIMASFVGRIALEWRRDNDAAPRIRDGDCAGVHVVVGSTGRRESPSAALPFARVATGDRASRVTYRARELCEHNVLRANASGSGLDAPDRFAPRV